MQELDELFQSKNRRRIYPIKLLHVCSQFMVDRSQTIEKLHAAGVRQHDDFEQSRLLQLLRNVMVLRVYQIRDQDVRTPGSRQEQW